MKELHLTLTLRNNLLRSRRLAAGLSLHELARQAHTDATSICAFERLKRSPLTKAGEWRLSARRLATYWKVLPEDLWPEAIQRVQKATVERTFDAAEVDALLSTEQQYLALPPDEQVAEAELRQKLEEVLQALSESQRDVLTRLANGETYAEIADARGVTRNRICQIRQQAMSTIWRRSYPARSALQDLREYLYDDDPCKPIPPAPDPPQPLEPTPSVPQMSSPYPWRSRREFLEWLYSDEPGSGRLEQALRNEGLAP